MNLKIGYVNKNICKKLLGVKVDNNLNFSKHLDGIMKNASRKVSALSTVIHKIFETNSSFSLK